METPNYTDKKQYKTCRSNKLLKIYLNAHVKKY